MNEWCIICCAGGIYCKGMKGILAYVLLVDSTVYVVLVVYSI
jgi:hypothetical protein